MSEKYKVIDSTVPTFITITVVDWVDLFVRPIYCNILDESLNYCIKEKGLSVHAYVYMTSHVHLIVTAFDGELQNVIRDFKEYTPHWRSFATSAYLPYEKKVVTFVTRQTRTVIL